jgi:hypothetical protein
MNILEDQEAERKHIFTILKAIFKIELSVAYRLEILAP